MKNHLKELFIKSERPSDFDNRSYYVKSLNKAIENGLEITLSKPGRVWFTQSGFKYNLKLAFNGKSRVYYISSGIEPYGILFHLSRDLKAGLFSTIGIDLREYDRCVKCDGKGFIGGFAHICNGVCFDCMGMGSRMSYKTVTA